MVVLDIPLLFEKGVPRGLAGVIVVSAPAWKQRQRVLRRPGMTPAKFGRIKKLQVPDEEKRRRADYIIDQGTTFERSRSEAHTSELQSLMRNSYAVYCLKKKNKKKK